MSKFIYIKMPTELAKSKQIIRRFIRDQFSDEKLAQVYAFNQDRKMVYEKICCCLIGVASSTQLHATPCEVGKVSEHHYMQFVDNVQGADAAEAAYRMLGFYSQLSYFAEDQNELRAKRFSVILRAEMKLRDVRRRRHINPCSAIILENNA